MRPEHPTPALIPGLRLLWQEAFGDSESYLDGFFRLAFAPENCLCIRQDPQIAAALYWLEMTCGTQRFAYLYAIATAKSHRGRGLCRTLMEQAKETLLRQGYAGAVLVPETPVLARMYEKMGFSPCCGIELLTVSAHSSPAPLRRVGPGEYQRLRAALLPENGLELGPQALAFLSVHAEFFAGDGWVLSGVTEDGQLLGLEFLGDPAVLPGIAAALGCQGGKARTPGSRLPFAWYLPLTPDTIKPGHLGFAFD